MFARPAAFLAWADGGSIRGEGERNRLQRLIKDLATTPLFHDEMEQLRVCLQPILEPGNPKRVPDRFDSAHSKNCEPGRTVWSPPPFTL